MLAASAGGGDALLLLLLGWCGAETLGHVGHDGEAHGDVEPVEQVLGVGVEVQRQVADVVAAVGEEGDGWLACMPWEMSRSNRAPFGFGVVGLDEPCRCATSPGCGAWSSRSGCTRSRASCTAEPNTWASWSGSVGRRSGWHSLPGSRSRAACVLPTDVADYDQVEAAAAKVEENLGPIDVWVNVAFTSVFAPFTEITAAEFKRVTEVTYLGFVYGTMAALSRMKPRDRGTIVQVGSALSYRGIPLQSPYCGAKHAINGFTESIRTELLHDKSNVHITVVQMPAVNTPQFSWVLSRLPNDPQPVPPIYQPEVAARGVLYAADHPRRKEYWVGASTAGTILGQKFAPGLLDRYLARTGFSSQQTNQPVRPERPNNLYHPVDGDGGRDHGAHGAFDDRSHAHSPQLWVSQHVRTVLFAAAAGLAGLVAALRRQG